MAEKITPFLENTDAVSEVIGEVLLTAIAVLAFSVVAVFIFSYAGPQEKVHADIQGWVGVDSDTIYLRHAGGETIDIPRIRVLLDINGTRKDLTPSEVEQIKGNDHWVLGETIRINASRLWSYDIGQDDYIAVTLISTDSNLVIKSGTLLGSAHITQAPPGGLTLTAPVLSGQNPASPFQSNTSQQVTFSASSSQSSINEFFLDGRHLAWSNGTSPSYTNTSPSEGTYDLTLVARNTTDPLLTDSIEWTWTVTAGGEAGNPIPGTDMRLQKTGKGGYIADGDYIRFSAMTGNSYVAMDGIETDVKNKDVTLVMNGQQTSGTASIDYSGTTWKIITYDFDVEFYLDGTLVNTGQVTDINIHKAENFESTLSYHLPAHPSQTYFSENGDSNILIDAPNSSEIRLYNITPTDGASFELEFNPDASDIAGFDALYEII
ncbi:type IV pilin N-terminal domain-containing protein [Methanolobus halotolerans]|uniref:Archaeal Type IV pilin N-terminal domain-containing protein n=1 Tax=Methanolobus halotolerans TaxID=2052935 RepID=A0A4E0QX08_9EURY|nr:type IV pilin N-terminal domain-containing protein [Methanolobus halotolerans]TGC06936.1 hypothetical protein CUN85_12410 [Methanolobus halotolerans]